MKNTPILNFRRHPVFTFFYLVNLFFTFGLKTKSEIKAVPEVSICTYLPMTEPKNFRSENFCYIDEDEEKPLPISLACLHPQQPLNKVNNRYELGIFKEKLLLFGVTSNQGLFKKMLSDSEIFLKAQEKLLSSYGKDIYQILAKYPPISLRDKTIVEMLVNSLVDAKAIVETNLTICGASTYFSIGKLVAAHILFGAPLPILIRVKLATEATAVIAATLSKQGVHVLPDHSFLFILDQKSNLADINEIKKILEENITGQGLTLGKDDYRIQDLLEKLRPTICDAWVGEPHLFNRNYSGEHVMNLFERSDLMRNMQVLMPEDLTSNEVIKAIVRYLYLAPEHSLFWSQQIDSYYNNFSRSSR